MEPTGLIAAILAALKTWRMRRLDGITDRRLIAETRKIDVDADATISGEYRALLVEQRTAIDRARAEIDVLRDQIAGLNERLLKTETELTEMHTELRRCRDDGLSHVEKIAALERDVASLRASA